MALRFIIEGSDTLRNEIVERALVELVDAAAEANAEWYWYEWAAGRLTPDEKCCAGCAGLLYVPDDMGKSITVRLVPVLLARGSASCQDAVAMSLGHERALAWLNGMPRVEARRVWHPKTEPTARGPRYWHLVVMGPNGRDDVTTEMKKGPAGAGGCGCSTPPVAGG